MFGEKACDTAAVAFAVEKVYAAVTDAIVDPQLLRLPRGLVEAVGILDGDDRVGGAVNDHERARRDAPDLTQRLHIRVAIASAPLQNWIREAGNERHERGGHVHRMGDAEAHFVGVGGEAAVSDEGPHLGPTRGAHDRDRGAHRVPDDAHPCTAHAAHRIIQRAEKIVELAISQRHRCAEARAVAVEVEEQHVVASAP